MGRAALGGVAEPVGTSATQGVDAPGTTVSAEEFGNAGSGGASAFPKVRVVAFVGRVRNPRAFLTAEVGRTPPVEDSGEPVVPAAAARWVIDSQPQLYSFGAWGPAAGTGVVLLWRRPMRRYAAGRGGCPVTQSTQVRHPSAVRLIRTRSAAG